ncbi:MAG: hypothetical protein ACOY3J_12420 [Bacillota bacterium]|uniref:Uncharacterized protein n=1 Tax=Thermanaerosceptrum fracticalcis TaxID=1712410 RepID=A0A7G6DZ39_THEFR|nr:hypothetical protein [Thermanaerosceptrum fracticalcis]QNB45093.1 hypothetical protein BR63_01405 [Thermanaerosceptrum fracticalcis]
MPKEKFLKFGGMKFKALVNPKEINTYVRSLSEDQRSSMFEVAKELENQGMIEFTGPLKSEVVDDSCL